LPLEPILYYKDPIQLSALFTKRENQTRDEALIKWKLF